MPIDEAKIKKQIAAIKKENPDKYFAHGKKLLAEAYAARAERKKRCDNDVIQMTKEAVVHMKRRSSGGLIFSQFAGWGERRPLVCDECDERTGSVSVVNGVSLCRKCRSKQQGNKPTAPLVMPKYLNLRRAS